MDKPEVDLLKCQVAGCNARWTVYCGWKRCSEHAWVDNLPTNAFAKAPVFDRPPVRPFTEIDDDAPY